MVEVLTDGAIAILGLGLSGSVSTPIHLEFEKSGVVPAKLLLLGPCFRRGDNLWRGNSEREIVTIFWKGIR